VPDSVHLTGWLAFTAQAFFTDLDRDGSRSLDLSEFIVFYKKCLASEQVKEKYATKIEKRLAKDDTRKAKQMFERYDADNSGAAGRAGVPTPCSVLELTGVLPVLRKC
jgi:Ca2+-binding EF-hand superfamily protein